MYKLKLNYTKDELKELKDLGKIYGDPMYAISQLLNTKTRGVGSLQAKYITMEGEKELDLMADINNVVMGTAVFPEQTYCLQQVFDGWVKSGVISASKAHEIVGSMLDLYHTKIQIVTKGSRKIMTIEANINDCKVEK